MTDSVRVLHIGDLHLGVEIYGRPDPEKGYGTRVGDFLQALDQALEHASRADLVVFPGDIYKNCDPNPTVQREFAQRIRRVAREVPVVLIPGNHDLPNAFARASSVEIFHVLEVENVHVLRRPEVVTLRTRRGPVLIAPLPFMARSRLVALEEARGKTIPEVLDMMRSRLIAQLEDLAGQVRAAREEMDPDTPAILMAHYTVEGATFGGYGRGGLLAPEVQLPLSAMRNEAWDYVALAHIHKHQSVPANDHTGQPPVVYPGSIERVDFGEEKEEKVVVLAEVSRGSADWRTIPLQPRPFLTLKVKAEEADPLASVKAQIEARRADIQGAVVRVLYELPAGHPNLPERELRACLEGAHYIAGIRRDTGQTPETRIRAGQMTTQLTPLEALEVYLKTQPQLDSKRAELLERGRALIAEIAPEGVEAA